MDSTITAIAVVVVLAAWHLQNRRHPGWRASSEGRFYVTSGYPLVMVAVYWLVTAPTATAWEWALGNVWALAAMMSFVWGFAALNRVTRAHAPAAMEMETIEPATGALPRQV